MSKVIKKIKKICPVCGKDVWCYLGQICASGNKYCSKDCYNKNISPNFRRPRGIRNKLDKGVYLNCLICGIEFRVKKYRKDTAQYCCDACRAIGVGRTQRGSNHPKWNGGSHYEDKKFRSTEEYEKWRTHVYQRDRWTCQKCGIKCNRHNIIAHHKLSFKYFPSVRYVVDNGITLCRNCHVIEHKKVKDLL